MMFPSITRPGFQQKSYLFSKWPPLPWKELATRDIILTEVSERVQLFPAFTPYVILHCSGEKSTPGAKFKYICCWYFASEKVQIPVRSSDNYCSIVLHALELLLFVNMDSHAMPGQQWVMCGACNSWGSATML